MKLHSDVLAAIAAKRIKATCTLCGHDDWQVPNDNNSPSEAMVLSVPVGMNLTELLQFVPMICRHCGNTHFLNLEALMGAIHE